MARLEVEIIGDSRSLERAFRRSEQSATRFNAKIGGVGRSVAGGFAVAYGAQGVAGFLKNSADAASNFAEQTSKTDAVFRRNAAEIKKWAGTSSDSMGLAKDQALEASSSFGALLAPLKIVGAEATRQSEQLTQLGVDLASFYNTDVQEALDAIRSGLVGEAEPLRRYGALLSETRVQAEALAETGKKSGSQLTDQEKVLARINLMLRDTKLAQGDFAKTQDGAANQTKKFNAQLRELEIRAGEGVLPVMVGAIGVFNDLAGAIEAANRKLEKLHVGFLNKGIADWGIFGGAHLNVPSGVPEGWGPGHALDVLERVRGHRGASFRGGGRAPTPPPPRPGASVELRNRWFDATVGRLLGRAGDPTSLREQIGRLREVSGLLTQRLAVTKDITRRLMLQDQLADVAMQIRGRQLEIADKAKADRAAQLDEQLGWLQFAAQRAEATKTIRDDVKAQRAIERWLLDRIRHEGRTLTLMTQLWEARQKIRDLNKSKADRDPLAGLMQVSSRGLARTLAAGTGLGVSGRRILEANIAGAEIRPVHVHVEIDGREVGRAVTTDQARTSRRTAKQTSGFRG